MVRRIFGTFLCALICLALPASGLAQQRKMLTASIPFSFSFGDQEMAQGEYTILVNDNGVVQVRSGNHTVSSLSRYATPKDTRYAVTGDSSGPNFLQFRRYGDSYFLSRIFWLDAAVELLKSRSEQEIAKRYIGTPTLETATAK